MVFGLVNQRDGMVIEVEMWVSYGEVNFKEKVDLDAYTYTILRLHSDDMKNNTGNAGGFFQAIRSMRDSGDHMNVFFKDGGDVWNEMRGLFKNAADRFGLIYHED